MSKHSTFTIKQLSMIEDNPIKEAKKLGIIMLEKLLIAASDAYYNSKGKDLLSDDTYDILIDYLREIKPKSKVLKQIGTQPIDDRTKVKLPYHLGSMDKIKPGSRKLDLWFSKYSSGKYNISDKLDGLSGLMVCSSDGNLDNFKLYTRGDGSYGQDISHLLKYINYGNKVAIVKYFKNKYKKKDNDDKTNDEKQIIIRGEIIINESLFSKKYSDKYPKSRSLVAGTVNSKPSSVNASIARDLEFIVYQVIEPVELTINSQLDFAKKNGFNTVANELIGNEIMEEGVLTEKLLERREQSEYKIDGIIITDNSQAYPNPSDGNPKHAVAFKMQLDEQQETTTVEEVEWNISKNGVLKPRIRYSPITIDGDTLVYTTGFNAKYIRDNVIGPGAKIRIIRSGDVIPYIAEVITGATSDKWSEPVIKYTWSNSGVEAVACDLSGSTQYLSKILVHFFAVLGIDGMKTGTINKLINAGFDTINTIIALKPENLLDVAGFNIRSAAVLVDNIKHGILDKKREFHLEIVMTASNVMTGFAVKKLKLIREFLVASGTFNTAIATGFGLVELTKDDIVSIDGFSDKTALIIIKQIPEFITWLERHPIIAERVINYTNLTSTNADNTSKLKKQISQKLLGEYIVMTGFRDAELQSNIESAGGVIQTGVNGKTTLLIIKDKESAKGSKWKKANDLGVKIITKDEFKI